MALKVHGIAKESASLNYPRLAWPDDDRSWVSGGNNGALRLWAVRPRAQLEPSRALGQAQGQILGHSHKPPPPGRNRFPPLPALASRELHIDHPLATDTLHVWESTLDLTRILPSRRVVPPASCCGRTGQPQLINHNSLTCLTRRHLARPQGQPQLVRAILNRLNLGHPPLPNQGKRRLGVGLPCRLPPWVAR